MSNALLTDLIPAEILQEIQDAFSEYSGMAALITDSKGSPVTKGSGFTKFCMEMTRKSEEGCRKCEACDRQGAFLTMQSGKPAVYSCHAGLTDYAAPILLNGGFIGSFIGGQVRTEPVNEEMMRKRAVEYNIDPDEYVAAAQMTNELKREEIDKAAYFLQKLAGVLSKVAFQAHQAFSQNDEMKENARNQSDFMMLFSNELKASIGELYTFFAKNKDDKNILLQKKVSGLMARTLELGSIAEDKVDLTNIMNGDFKLQETIYNIRSVAEMKVLEYGDQAEKAGNRIEFNIADDVPGKVVGDPARIGSVIGKLIEYCNKRSQGTVISVEIDTKVQSYATQLHIIVSDGGTVADKKFTDYIHGYLTSRGYSDLRDEELDMSGLSLVGYHINAMSGTLEVNSEEGKGIEFVIRLPQLTVTGGEF